jgi:putative ABC transport system ATP-binding protein
MAEALVRTYGLCKRYRSGEAVVHALNDISLVIERGEFLAILGRSGSGKSTLLHLLGLLDRPDTGQYSFADRCVEDVSEDERAAIRNREIGFVFQLPAFLPRATALENVALPLAYAPVGRRIRKRLAEEALASVGLSHRASHWPQQLSGGEQQRVAIARAIVSRPTLILADEPTGALDSVTSDEILSLFERLNEEGRTIVVVTHDDEVARRAHRCMTMRDGSIVSQIDATTSHQDPALQAESVMS